MDCSTPGVPVLHHLPQFAQVHVHFIGDAVQPSHSLTLSSLSAINLPSIRDFSNKSSAPIRWPKYWSFNISISPSSEYLELISLKIDWFDLFAVQGTFTSLLQCHILKASILWHSFFFVVQLSQLYVTTGKTIALTIWTFVGRVMSLLFNTLWRLVITFLLRNNHLILRLQSTMCSDFGTQEEELCYYSHLLPFYLPWSNGGGCYDLSF